MPAGVCGWQSLRGSCRAIVRLNGEGREVFHAESGVVGYSDSGI